MWCRSAKNYKFFVLKTVTFPRKTYQFCHCEEGALLAPDVAIFDGTKRHPGTKYRESERNRIQKKAGRSETTHITNCILHLFILLHTACLVSCPRASLRDSIPQAFRSSSYLLPFNNTENGRFSCKTCRLPCQTICISRPPYAFTFLMIRAATPCTTSSRTRMILSG